MKPARNNEQGSILIEVLATLALLGVMGTFLYRQVQMRNQEIQNVNIANEMRIVKEAFASYIQANYAALADDCKARLTEGSVNLVSCGVSKTDVAHYLPAGFEELLETADMYSLELYAGYQSAISTRVLLQGLIKPSVGILPQMNLKRIARIAALIGTEGGICDTSGITGTMGSWGLDVDEDTCPAAIPVAITGMNYFVPEQTTETGTRVFLPESVAFNHLHAWRYFSVAGSSGCYDLKSRTLDGEGKALSDVIYGPDGNPAAGADCDPLFWVGQSANSAPDTDTSLAGMVYVKNNLMVGRDNSPDTGAARHAVEIGPFMDDSEGARRRIVVFNATGQERLVIDENGNLIGRYQESGSDVDTIQIRPGSAADNTDPLNPIAAVSASIQVGATTDPDRLTISGGQITTGRSTFNTMSEGKDLPYNLDPAYTSMMNDIRLASRGGARLSEILPNHILMDVREMGGGNFPITKPTCPADYYPAIVIVPKKFTTPVTGISLPAHSHEITGGVTNAPNDPSPTTHTHNIPPLQTTQIGLGTKGNDTHTGNTGNVGTTNPNFIEQDPFAVEFRDYQGGDPGWSFNGDPAWYIQLGPVGSDGTLRPDSAAQSWVQTFCVYKPWNEFTGGVKGTGQTIDDVSYPLNRPE